jgi:hypothetical protein
VGDLKAMSTSKKNKFNRTKTINGNTPPLGYFPIKQFRFRTENHPVIISNDRCSSSVKALWSQQELLMIMGLANSLRCSDREAVRIAIHEAAKAERKYLEIHKSSARSGSTEKGHEGRSVSRRLQMTRGDKEKLSEQAKTLGIKEPEMLRLCIIYLERGIRDSSVKSLTDSPPISQIELFRDWSRGKNVTESKLKALRLAADKAWFAGEDEAWELSRRYDQRKKLQSLYKAENPGLNSESLDAVIEAEQAQIFETLVQKWVLEQKLNDEEEHVFRLMVLLDLNEEEAQEIYKQELEAANNELGDEELSQIVMTFLEELEEERIMLKLDERFGDEAAPISEAQYLARKEWAISELENEKRERTNELNRSITKRLERNARRRTPEYRDNSRVRAIFDKNIQIPWHD